MPTIQHQATETSAEHHRLSGSVDRRAPMTQASHIKALLAAHASRDDAEFRRAAEELADEEARKGHRLLAKDLRRLLDHGSGISTMPRPSRIPDVPVDAERGLPLATVEHPEEGLGSVVLPEDVRETLRLL